MGSGDSSEVGQTVAVEAIAGIRGVEHGLCPVENHFESEESASDSGSRIEIVPSLSTATL